MLNILEFIVDVEHACMVHIEIVVEIIQLVMGHLFHVGLPLALPTRSEVLLHLDHLKDVHLLPSLRLDVGLYLVATVELKILELKIEVVLNKLLYSLHVDFIELGDDARADESVLEPQPALLAVLEHQTVEIEQNELQRLRVAFVYLDDLGDAACVEWLVFDVAEKSEDFSYFVLHLLYMELIIGPRVFKQRVKKKSPLFFIDSPHAPLAFHRNQSIIEGSLVHFNFGNFYCMSMRQVIKSLSDKRIYKPLILNNDLQCLVISDKDAQKSAAALSVGVGSFSDPLQAQGLAHYLEHMLFMGTSKYPVENEYSNFLSKNAGSSNAYTSLEQTNYFFQVSHGAFHDTLDRFSRFFIDPLMLQSSSERQLNAVHSEHSKNLQSDAWRKYQLTKHLSKEGHPYHKFSTGDKNSLGNPNLREMLFKFYNTHYSSNLMKLVVYGQDDVDRLIKSVQQKFNDVKNYQYGKFKIHEHPFGEKVLGKIIKLVPVKDRRILSLSWLLSNQKPYYRFPPAKYVTHILGHQGKDSLLSFLISQGLATSLSAGGSDSYDCYSQFQVSIALTDKGVAHFREVIQYVFHFIQILKDSDPQSWVVQQIQRVNKMKFDFLQKRQGMNFCSGMASSLHRRNMQQLFIYPYLMEQFKPTLIKEYIDQLGTENLIVMAQSKTFQPECREVEPIYQSKYCIQQLGSVSPRICKVAFPQHNFFIPNDLTILPLGSQKYPRKVYQSEFIQAFFKEDHQFALPKAELSIRIYFKGQNTSKQQVIKSLFQKMLRQKLRQFVYLAEMAQLDSQFEISSYYTMNITVMGFRDSFDKFINQYLRQILEFKPTDQQLFQTLRQKQRKEYANGLLSDPYRLAYESIVNALREGSSTATQQKLSEVDKVTLDDIASFAQSWRDKTFIQTYMTGNITEEHSVRIIKSVQDIIKLNSRPLEKKLIGTIRPIFLPVGQVCAVEQVLKSKDESNSSLIVHYQYEATAIKTKILQQLANSFVKEPAFDFLRTKEQLGYIVMTLQDDHRGVLGLSVLVQSNIKNTYELQKYVSKFVNQILRQKIINLDEKTFNQYKNSLYNTKIQKDKNLNAEASRFWGEIVRHSYEFTRKEKEIQLIPNISLQDFKNFLNNLFYDNPRIFEIHQLSQESTKAVSQLRSERIKNQPHFKLFPNIQTFRKKMPLYPDYYSHL